MDDTTALESKTLVVGGDRSELRLEAGECVLRKEATTQARPTEVRFGIDRVRGATLQRPSGREAGWLHVAVVGGSPPPPGALAAASDPYTLPLVGRTSGAARRLAKMIERHVQVRGLPQQTDAGTSASSGVVLNPDGAPSAPAGGRAGTRDPARPDASTRPDGATGHDLVGRLRELADLHDVGALTDEEFDRAKARVWTGERGMDGTPDDVVGGRGRRLPSPIPAVEAAGVRVTTADPGV